MIYDKRGIKDGRQMERSVNRSTLQSILALKNVDEIYNFLEDAATIGEIRALAQRLEVARLLEEGYTYPQIAQQTGGAQLP